jgi:PhnB protein
MLMRYKESPEPPPPGKVPAGRDNKIMHTHLRTGNANLMASDGCSEGLNFQGFSLSLSPPNEAEAQHAFAALADGGQGTDAARDLVAVLWHGRRPFRRRVDG